VDEVESQQVGGKKKWVCRYENPSRRVRDMQVVHKVEGEGRKGKEVEVGWRYEGKKGSLLLCHSQRFLVHYSVR
jgi:hypothetical protein